MMIMMIPCFHIHCVRYILVQMVFVRTKDGACRAGDSDRFRTWQCSTPHTLLSSTLLILIVAQFHGLGFLDVLVRQATWDATFSCNHGERAK
mmetsp:Transcript_2433/g.6766  ORF Transcript_2433/g.6766 Transcript_2433/m.6766 type:complete len:92 (-) Transcript_2433:357-632(-)